MLLILTVPGRAVTTTGEFVPFTYTEGTETREFETFDEWYFYTEMRVMDLIAEGFVQHDSKDLPTPYRDCPWSSLLRIGTDEVWVFKSDYGGYSVRLFYRRGCVPRTDLSNFTEADIGTGGV